MSLFLFGFLIINVIKFFIFIFLIFRILSFLFSIFGNSPSFFTNFLSFFNVISDQNVVKDGTRLDLPQIETDFADFIKLGNVLSIISIVFGVVDFGMDPFSFVVWVIDLSWFPFSLVVRVIDHRWFPFAVHFIIPILRFGSIRISNMFRLIPVLGFGVFGIINLGPIVPIFRFFGFRILDFLGWQKVPVLFKSSFLSRFVINENFVGTIRLDNQGVEMGENVILATDFLLNQVILAFVVEDDMDFLGSRTTDVRAEHNEVRGFSVHVSLVQRTVKKLGVTTTTINVLFMFDCELND